MKAKMLSGSQNEKLDGEQQSSAFRHVFNADCGRCEWCDVMQSDSRANQICAERQSLGCFSVLDGGPYSWRGHNRSHPLLRTSSPGNSTLGQLPEQARRFGSLGR